MALEGGAPVVAAETGLHMIVHGLEHRGRIAAGHGGGELGSEGEEVRLRSRFVHGRQHGMRVEAAGEQRQQPGDVARRLAPCAHCGTGRITNSPSSTPTVSPAHRSVALA